MAERPALWELRSGRSEGYDSSKAEAGPPEALSDYVARKLSCTKEQFDEFAGACQGGSSKSLPQTAKRRSRWCIPIFSPAARWYAWWSLLMLLLDLSYTAVAVPLGAAFASRREDSPWFAVDFAAGFFFFVDLLISFHVGYLAQCNSHRKLVLDRRTVAMIYLRTTFFIDLISCSAWFAQIALVVATMMGSGSQAELASALRILRVLRVLRVARLLKRLYLSNLQGGSSASRQLLGMGPATRHLLQMLYTALVIVNFVGCIWYFTAREEGLEGTWVNYYITFVRRYGGQGSDSLTAEEVHGIPITERYLASIYWALTTIITLGYGDIYPSTPAETIVCMCVELAGVALFGAMLSSIAALVQNASKDARRAQMLRDKVVRIEAWMRAQRLPKDVRRRVRHFYADVWVRQQEGLDEAAFFDELPHVLRSDVMAGMAARVLPRLPGFAALGAGALRNIASRLVSLQLPPGHVLYEMGDPAPCAWILHEGEVELRDEGGMLEFAQDPALLAGYALQPAARSAQGAGAVPGAASCCHPGGIQTASVCRLWQLSLDDLEAALRSRPGDLAAFRLGLAAGLEDWGSTSSSFDLPGGAAAAREGEAGGEGGGGDNGPGLDWPPPSTGARPKRGSGDSVALWVDARSRAPSQAEAGREC